MLLLPDKVRTIVRGLADSLRAARRADRAQHSESGVDVLRRRCEPVGDPDESQQRLAFVPLK
jgi:hypothetical protein